MEPNTVVAREFRVGARLARDADDAISPGFAAPASRASLAPTEAMCRLSKAQISPEINVSGTEKRLHPIVHIELAPAGQDVPLDVGFGDLQRLGDQFCLMTLGKRVHTQEMERGGCGKG